VSQTKKRVTNEKRARRLGTGEGIARPKGGGPRRGGGVPAWAWVVGGALLAGAVIVAVAIVLAGGGGGSGPQAGVVEQRLSHAKLDFVSRPTWQPNYDRLQQAVTALNLPGLSQEIVHYHVHITLYVDGHKVVIPGDMGYDVNSATNTVSQASPIHTHDDTGLIHVEADRPGFHGTLGQVFDVWGVYFTNQCIGGYCDGVKIWVDGKPTSAGPGLVLKNHQAITIVEGAPPPSFKPDATFDFKKAGV
jgi:hypothetical protein